MNTSHYTTALVSFRTLSQDEVKKLILQSPVKSCDLDPFPAWLLRLCLDELLATITKIVNLSIESSTMPDDFELALLLPSLRNMDWIYYFQITDLFLM